MFYTPLSIIFISLLLTGCTGAWQSTYETAKAAFIPSNTIIKQAKLDPKYHYLRFEVNGKAVTLVLGFIDPHPNGSIEIWYGGDPVMVRLQHGRFIGSNGLKTNWQEVRTDHLPDLTIFNQTQRYTRTRQQTPGTQFGIHETVLVTPLNEVPAIAPKTLKELSREQTTTSSIHWFSEVVENENASTLPAYYAVEIPAKLESSSLPLPRSRIIFGYQCLASNYCISWHAWPAPWTKSHD